MKKRQIYGNKKSTGLSKNQLGSAFLGNKLLKTWMALLSVGTLSVSLSLVYQVCVLFISCMVGGVYLFIFLISPSKKWNCISREIVNLMALVDNYTKIFNSRDLEGNRFLLKYIPLLCSNSLLIQ